MRVNNNSSFTSNFKNGMNRKEIHKFLIWSVFFLSPLILIMVLYFVCDPFMVLRHYDSYYTSGKPMYVILDRDYISTSTFENQHKKYGYNSFIFGNSRSIFYEVKDWEKHLDSTAVCFHFDASGESLYGIEKKVAFADKQQALLKNALLILDYSTFEIVKPGEGHLAAIAPQLESWYYFVPFHIKFIKAYLNGKFLKAYFDLKLTGKFKEYMKADKLLDDRPLGYRLETNELYLPFEQLIAADKYYTQERMSVFYERDTIQKYSPQVIGSVQKRMLHNIYKVFKTHKTNYKIVINPLYDQVKLNSEDIKYLKKLFGSENVFDFSGINDITADYRNYYEQSHYRPHIARRIMDTVYVQRGKEHQ